jgi:flagellar biosynthetic protein FliP
MKKKKTLLLIFGFLGFLLFHPVAGPKPIAAQGITPPAIPNIPKVHITLDKSDQPEDVSTALQILFLFTILSLAPAILIMVTSFTRIVVVLSFFRQALGTHQLPTNQIIIGLSLFLTFFIMSPIIKQINAEAMQPYLSKKMSQAEAWHKALQPIRKFMFRQTREKDLALFVKIAKIDRPKRAEDIPTSILIPSFVISELKTAFQIGFLIYLPFLIVDMVVSSVLLSMGMMMLPPVMISLPFKLIFFVLIDGWNLMVGSLVKGFV